MSRNDPPWGANGVACLKAACAASDHHKRATLVHLGGFWLSLAHAPPAQIDSVMAARIAAMERIQAELRGRLPRCTNSCLASQAATRRAVTDQRRAANAAAGRFELDWANAQATDQK
jgi:hypothetical protein